jgi:hypothetical protein
MAFHEENYEIYQLVQKILVEDRRVDRRCGDLIILTFIFRNVARKIEGTFNSVGSCRY